jgi:hypothetical protein
MGSAKSRAAWSPINEGVAKGGETQSVQNIY